MRACCMLLLLPCWANAASLRPMGTLAGPEVRLRDLFDDAGAAGERVLGPSPAPGGRITVGAAQLGAIARAYGIDWQPQSDADQAVLERPGQPLPSDVIIAALRPALVAQGAGTGGAGADFQIVLPFYDPPMLDTGSLPRVNVRQVALDGPSGRFSALVEVDTGAVEALPLRLVGSIEVSMPVAVPTRRLLPGAIVEAGDLVVQRVPARLVSGEVARDPAQAIGMQLRHMEFAGQPVLLADLVRPNVVAKGERVMMALAMPGLDVGAVGEALAPGGVGDQISVRNPVSGAILTAEVIGAGHVRVEADAPPALPGTAQLSFAER